MKTSTERNRRWRNKQKANGKCIYCNEKLVNKNHCKFHAKKNRENVKKYNLKKKEEKNAVTNS